MQPLVALELDLHKAQAVQGDFVGHYVVDDHAATSRRAHCTYGPSTVSKMPSLW
jgi:hypothetical protein